LQSRTSLVIGAIHEQPPSLSKNPRLTVRVVVCGLIQRLAGARDRQRVERVADQVPHDGARDAKGRPYFGRLNITAPLHCAVGGEVFEVIKGFKDFLLRGNVVAVAVVIGVAFGLVVSAFTDKVVKPLINAITPAGSPGLGFSPSFPVRTPHMWTSRRSSRPRSTSCWWRWWSTSLS